MVSTCSPNFNQDGSLIILLVGMMVSSLQNVRRERIIGFWVIFPYSCRQKIPSDQASFTRATYLYKSLKDLKLGLILMIKIREIDMHTSHSSYWHQINRHYYKKYHMWRYWILIYIAFLQLNWRMLILMTEF